MGGWVGGRLSLSISTSFAHFCWNSRLCSLFRSPLPFSYLLPRLGVPSTWTGLSYLALTISALHVVRPLACPLYPALHPFPFLVPMCLMFLVPQANPPPLPTPAAAGLFVSAASLQRYLQVRAHPGFRAGIPTRCTFLARSAPAASARCLTSLPTRLLLGMAMLKLVFHTFVVPPHSFSLPPPTLTSAGRPAQSPAAQTGSSRYPSARRP